MPFTSEDQLSASVRVQLLGDFGVFAGACSVPVRHGGQRVLALLSLHHNPMPRSRIAGTLWPFSAAGQSSANLRAALSRLPRPGGRTLTASTHGNELGLAEHVEVDMWICDTQMRELRTPTAEPLQDGPAEGRDAAMSLLAHDVLPLWDEDWVLVDRERHRQSRLHALERLSSSLRHAGLFEEALQAALAAVAGESLRESAHRRVIEVHLAEENHGEALRQYEIYRRLLRRELGLSPSATIRQLVGH